MGTWHIERARPDDAQEVLGLLTRNHLPLDGLLDHLATTLVIRQNGQIIGSAALEVYTEGALLCSVAVAPEAQGQGLGHDLTDAAIRLAQAVKAPAMYLLTTTA